MSQCLLTVIGHRDNTDQGFFFLFPAGIAGNGQGAESLPGQLTRLPRKIKCHSDERIQPSGMKYVSSVDLCQLEDHIRGTAVSILLGPEESALSGLRQCPQILT